MSLKSRLGRRLSVVLSISLIFGFFGGGPSDARDGAAAIIASTSTISYADVNPSVTITLQSGIDTFVSGTLQVESFTVTTDKTELTFASVTKNSGTSATLSFTGTAKIGAVTVRALASAFTLTSTASNILTFSTNKGTISSETFTATPSSTSIAVGDSLTVAVANQWTSSGSDTSIIGYNITVPANGTAPKVLWTTANDTVNATSVNSGAWPGLGAYQNYSWAAAGSLASVETFTSGTGTALFNRAAGTLSLQEVPSVGTYYVSVYVTGADGYAVARKSVNFSFTVTRPTISSARLYVSQDTRTAQLARQISGPAVDSTIAVSAGTSTTPTFAAVVYATGLVSGDTVSATGANNCTNQVLGYCEVTVTISGPGLIALSDNVTGTWSGTQAKAQTMKLYNGKGMDNAGETLIVFSDGTAGTGTITFSSGTTTLATKTMTFFGPAASATLAYGDTIIAVGATSAAVKAWVKDAGGNAFTGTVYLYSSDTAIISDSATACTYSSTLGYHSCTVTAVDTGTATVKVSNRATQSAAASTTALATWFSSTLSFTVRGVKIQSFTATLDKTTYGPGDKAILTITAKDRAGNSMANGAISNAFVVTSSKSFTDIGAPTTFTPGTSGAEDGVETRVIYMPTVAGTFTYTMSMGSGSLSTTAAAAAVADVVVTATVKDPTADAIADAKATAAAAQASADAATDAALQAIDAANAATDAANLAAEAADAATVAAQESKDSADAATAAVESLATQVATLMAALQAQITSLANVVAKIAKKVKA